MTTKFKALLSFLALTLLSPVISQALNPQKLSVTFESNCADIHAYFVTFPDGSAPTQLYHTKVISGAEGECQRLWFSYTLPKKHRTFALFVAPVGPNGTVYYELGEFFKLYSPADPALPKARNTQRLLTSLPDPVRLRAEFSQNHGFKHQDHAIEIKVALSNESKFIQPKFYRAPNTPSNTQKPAARP